MEQYLAHASQVHFEAVCLVDLASLGQLAGPAIAKLTKFCKDSSLGMYLVAFMDGGRPHALFLTKQRLIPSTGYFCSAGNLGVRRFASVEVLVANTVKRIMPKSDSKFIDKFTQLLDSDATYCRQVGPSHVLLFKKHQEGCLQFWHEKLEKDPKPAIKVHIKPRSLFRVANEKIEEKPPKINEVLASGETFMTTSMPLNPKALVPCQINPPNILCSMWEQPSLIIKYFQRKALEGNREEGDCKKAFVTLKNVQSNQETYKIPGFGTIVVPPDVEENSIQEKEKGTSLTQTCESTPEQPRGYAARLTEQDDNDSGSQDLDEPSSKAIAQTMALISSGKKRTLDDSSHYMNLFSKFKRTMIPGRRFTLF